MRNYNPQLALYVQPYSRPDTGEPSIDSVVYSNSTTLPQGRTPETQTVGLFSGVSH